MAVYTDVPDDELPRFRCRLRSRRGGLVQGHRRGRREFELPPAHRDRHLLPDALRATRGDPADLPFFLALMEHLAGRRHRLPDADQGARRRGAAPVSAAGRRPSSRFLDGLWPRRIQPFHCAGARRRAWRGCTWPARHFAMPPRQRPVARRLAPPLRSVPRAAPTRCAPASPPRSRTSSTTLAQQLAARSAGRA